jgi:hypothetical protein
MKITTDKTNYLLVTAGDSRLSGTDYAVITIDDKLLEQLKKAKMLIDISKGTPGGVNIQMDDDSCNYLEVEKLNESLFQRIEQLKQNKELRHEYIDQELYNELIETCAIETSYSGNLNVAGDRFSFELYDEGGGEGYYLVFRTEDIPLNEVL